MSILYVFFGGFQADKTAMELWLASACNLRDDIKFLAYPYPSPHASDTAAVAGFKKNVGFDTVIDIINKSGADTLFIVGHSSGCAIANALNALVDPDKFQITLIDLDGFAPHHDQRKKSVVEAWSADGPDPKKDQSLRWSAHHKMSHSTEATKKWALHFFLVNKTATDKITHKNYDTEGYAGCIANLDWLPGKKP